jgi:hypothetical protein
VDLRICSEIRNCHELTNYADCAGWVFKIKEEKAAVPGIRHEMASALAGDGVLMPCTARLSDTDIGKRRGTVMDASERGSMKRRKSNYGGNMGDLS